MAKYKREDFLLDEDGDFPLEDNVVNGVYEPTGYGESDEQHKIDCIQYTKGNLKEFPTSGFGIMTYLEGEYDSDKTYSLLSQQIEDDGYKLKNNAILPDPNGGFSVDTDLIDNNY